jgi:copper chaperone CopZ
MAAETLHITVRGMTCANCARSVERKLSGTPGVTKAVVELQGERAVVDYDTDMVKPEVLKNAVRELGFDAA